MRVRLFAADAAGKLEELDAGTIDLDAAAMLAAINEEAEAEAIVAALRACVWGGAEQGGAA